MGGRVRKSGGDGGDPDVRDLITGTLVRAIGALSAETLVPGKAVSRPSLRRSRLIVPCFYFADGRDRSLPLRQAMSYGHRNPEVELCIQVSGSPLLVVERDAYLLRPGDLGLLSPGVTHFETCSHPRRPYRLLWVILSGGVSSLHVTYYTPGAGYTARVRATIGSMGPAVQELASLGAAAGAGAERLRAIRTALLSVASRAARFLSTGQARGEGTVSQSVRRAEEFMRANYLTGISVADVAQAAHLSPNYLSTVFREATGTTILERIHELKLAEARSRLSETDEPVKKIAFDLRFDSPHYFSRFFRLATGQTPSEFRQGRATQPAAPRARSLP